jgi:acetyl-CoA carboxylase biotin carboxyl carrier protein
MSDKKTGAGVDPQFVRELATILKDQDLNEIELEQGELKLRLVKAAPVMAAAPIAYAPAPAPMAAPAPAAPASSPMTAAPLAPAIPAGAIRSPMVGTAYLAAEPGAAPFVKVGDMVNEGQTLLIVEAMKTFNPIPSPRSGRVKQILVSDQQPVEYDEPLIILD